MEYYQKHLATREEYLGKRETAYTNVYKAEIKSDSGSSARGLNKNLSTTPIFRRFAAIFLQQPVPPPVPRTIGDKNSWLGQIVWKSIEIYSHTKKKKIHRGQIAASHRRIRWIINLFFIAGGAAFYANLRESKVVSVKFRDYLRATLADTKGEAAFAPYVFARILSCAAAAGFRSANERQYLSLSRSC